MSATASILLEALRSIVAATMLDTMSSSSGMNVHLFHPRPGEIESLRKAGYGWVRRDVLWDVVERVPGTHRFDGWVRLVDSLESHGIRALLVLCYGHPVHTRGQPPRTPLEIEAFTRFAASAAKAFQGRGVIWEIWNEPNMQGFWSPRPDPAEYIAVLKAAAAAMRKIDPKVVILGPSQAGIDTVQLASWLSLRLLDHVDGISFHPYRGGRPETILEEVAAYRRAIAKANARRKVPLVISEWGYSTFRGKTGVLEDLQARYLVRLRMLSVASGVPLHFWYDWMDDGADETNQEHRFGVVRRGASFPLGRVDRKPAYQADSVLSGFLTGSRIVGIERPDSVRWRLKFTRGSLPWSTTWRTSTTEQWVEIQGACTTMWGEPCRVRRKAGRRTEVLLGPEPVYLR